MACSSSEPLFVSSDSSSDDLSELLERENDLFNDLIPNDEDDAPSLPSSTPPSSSSSEHPAKRRKLRAINTWKLSRELNNQEPLVNSKGRQYWYCARCTSWRDVVTTNIRSHLLNIHGITIKEEDLSLKRAAKNRLKELFRK